ncbi:hypothetical protein LYNGBM3L_68320 [Moorena producens 3L]|uniref:Uncharacterized protein n=1 Tax=Moorena producens 3L TaxID=489825 RepID=F4Y2S2_9CYAN|nr:hypothetical protein LYNGBM3L_68320 [Moorena producens 3L]
MGNHHEIIGLIDENNKKSLVNKNLSFRYGAIANY